MRALHTTILLVSFVLLLRLTAPTQIPPNASHTSTPSARQTVLAAIKDRPSDPWPRGTGHVVLATPGTREALKSYLEPGGSFSPAVGSFGISFWVSDKTGKLLATSDSIPLEQLHQTLDLNRPRTAQIITETNFYRSAWGVNSNTGQIQLAFDLKQRRAGQKIWLVLRSVGPAGGPVNSLRWSRHRLLVNQNWMLDFNRAPSTVILGHEGDKGWTDSTKTAKRSEKEWSGVDGWGYAQVLLDESHPRWRVVVSRAKSTVSDSPLAEADYNSTLELNIPDRNFAASLNAQTAHLMMSLVGRETRPGEPTNYPLNWLRDGAYVISALARAGQVKTAKELSREFAEKDFFGGFGAEADAPGLAIWALEETAIRAHDRQFDLYLWPHVQRKVGWILQMLAAEVPLHAEFSGPIVPRHAKNKDLSLLCDPARDGLIIGKMDHHRPVLFINAVSYRGLLDAATLALRLGKKDEAARWRTRAEELRRAWNRALKPPEANNDRTYISGIWPSGVVDQTAEQIFQANLEKRWHKLHDEKGEFRQTPLWTYFDLAEAHQWLMLGESARTLNTLQWFWNHQASPGLYTWWEGQGEENNFGLWENIRGWVQPRHVTPHYWTAAEMLLLQIDMLAYLDERADELPTLVIGAGIAPDWLKNPMSVSGLMTSRGQVDWLWDKGRMLVTIDGAVCQNCNIRLGKSFPAGTPLTIKKR